MKLKEVSYEHIKKLTSRGIRAATNDPLAQIEKIIHFITKHFFEKMKISFEEEFNVKIPMVMSTTEFLTRTKTEENDTSGIHFECDVTDLYSCVSYDMICDAFDFANGFLNYSQECINFIKKIYKIAMNNAYFKEPDGIYSCDIGLAMGSHLSAIASDFVLSTSEYKSYRLLKLEELLEFVYRHYRLRDDIIAKFKSDIEKIKKILKLLFSCYPKGLEFNLTTNILFSKFLDVRLVSEPKKLVDTLTILRKEPCRFDVISQASNTHKRYKSSALNHYIDRIENTCNSYPEKCRQTSVTRLILSYKGYSRSTRLLRKKSNRKFVHDRAFLSTIKHDQVTNSHVKIKRLLKKCSFPSDRFYIPTDIPDKKVRQFIFTKSKLINNIWQN